MYTVILFEIQIPSYYFLNLKVKVNSAEIRFFLENNYNLYYNNLLSMLKQKCIIH